MATTTNVLRERLKTLLLLLMGVLLVMSWGQTQSHAEAPKVTAECVTVLPRSPGAMAQKNFQGRVVGEDEGGLPSATEKWMQAQQAQGKESFTVSAASPHILVVCAY